MLIVQLVLLCLIDERQEFFYRARCHVLKHNKATVVSTTVIQCRRLEGRSVVTTDLT